MEMQTNNHLSYTNQLPKWAIGFHIGLISFLGLIGVGLVVLAVVEGINEGSVFFLIFMGISAVFLGLSWYAYRNLQKYIMFIVKIDLVKQVMIII